MYKTTIILQFGYNIFLVLAQSDADVEWKVIKPDVFAAIMDFFTTGLPVVNEDSIPSPDTGRPPYAQLVLLPANPSLPSRCINMISFRNTHGPKNTDRLGVNRLNLTDKSNW